MYFVDTHTHLYADQFNDDRDLVIQKSIEQGINQFYLPNIDSTSIPKMKALVEKYPDNCIPMMGLHPCSVNGSVREELSTIKKEIENGTYSAIGEIGIDLYWDKTYLEEQEMAFRSQIQWAKTLGLPIVIHCREAFDEILSILDELNDDNLSGVFHCFTGNLEQANHILDYGGFKLGIGGVVTFKNAGLDKTLAKLKIDDLVLETDSPYLAPAPYRGKRNESAYLIEIAQKVAEVFSIPLDKVAEITSHNAQYIFNK